MTPIILAHNYYKQRGGEDKVFEFEAALLRERGHDVHLFVVDNHSVPDGGSLAAVARAFWSRRTTSALRALIRRTGARLVHIHNTFPTMSPSIFRAARAEGAAVVLTLHNFRLFCIQGFFMRNERLCEECLDAPLAYPGVRYRCYRGSVKASGVATTMIQTHWALGTWHSAADRYVALTEFARSKLVQGGLPAGRIEVKPNFVAPDPGVGSGDGDYVVFVGRLSAEKGIRTLLAAWESSDSLPPLYILGDGPLAREVSAAASRIRTIRPTGFQSHAQVMEWVGSAKALIISSVGYEPACPMVVIEALARGTPIIASRLGPLPEAISNGRHGHLFEAGDPVDLARQVRALLDLPRARYAAMRAACRGAFEAHYTAEVHYDTIMRIYRSALASASRDGAP